MSRSQSFGRIILSVTISAAVFTGCSKPTPESSAAEEKAAPSRAAAIDSKAIDACRYFNKEDAEKALGLPISETETMPYNPVTKESECRFKTTSMDPPVQALSINVKELSKPEESFADLRKLMGSDIQTVDGVGEQAFYGASQLFALKDLYQVTTQVTYVVRSPDKRREIAAEVAKQVLAKL